MISERDYVNLVQKASGTAVSQNATHTAIQIATAANNDAAQGVVAFYATNQTVSGSIWVVARDAQRDGAGNVFASQYFVGAANLSGVVSWSGAVPQLSIDSPFTDIVDLMGPCGYAELTQDIPVCDTPGCLPPGVATDPNADYGQDGLPDHNIVSFQIPSFGLPTRDSTKFICDYFSPPLLSNNDCGPVGFPPATEICNGLDDNCNGQIDEGFDENNNSVEGEACSNRQTGCTTCTLAASANCVGQGVSCGAIPDGCGGTIVCGGSCP